ncbi:methyl-accepting chemotaxis protein [Vibrio gigantis]|uniref:methyl-accepting chemotaxis protein n=1 Tax=Vibrio gigantis TaxID=296199 RepID=UPI001BFD1987|nr:methyl-accepting chemotaxis protein [Vibrio gigantis]
MKKVDMRWIDRLFVKINLNEKFYLLNLVYLLCMLIALTGVYSYYSEAMTNQKLLSAEKTLDLLVKHLGTNVIDSQIGVSLVDKEEQAQLGNGYVTITKSYEDGRVYQFKTAISQENNASILPLLSNLLWLVLPLIVSYYISTFISGALWVLHDTISKIKHGNLTSRLGFIPGRDEFGQIGCKLDETMDSLLQFAVLTSKASDNVAQKQEQIMHLIDSNRSNFKSEISSIEQVTTAVVELSSTTGINETNAVDVDRAISDVCTAMESNKDALQVSKNLLNDVVRSVLEAKSITDEVKELTENVGSVVNIIDTISSQANLLALNAAIEAARAGELESRGVVLLL